MLFAGDLLSCIQTKAKCATDATDDGGDEEDDGGDATDDGGDSPDDGGDATDAGGDATDDTEVSSTTETDVDPAIVGNPWSAHGSRGCGRLRFAADRSYRP